MLLQRNNNYVTGCFNVVGYLFEGSVYMEPMTIWKKEHNSGELIPQKHDSTKYMWSEFEYFFEPKPSDSVYKNNQRAEVLNWYTKIMGKSKKTICTGVVSLVYDEKKTTSLPVKNVFSDSLTMHAGLLSELGADWRAKIEAEIDRCGKLASITAVLAQNLYVASGGSNSKKDKHFTDIPNVVKSQLYYRFDIPFREWLRSVDPAVDDEKKKSDKRSEWQSTARRITETYARELVSETSDAAIIGHKEGDVLYSSPKAMIKFRGQLKKIYGEEGDRNG